MNFQQVWTELSSLTWLSGFSTPATAWRIPRLLAISLPILRRHHRTHRLKVTSKFKFLLSYCDTEWLAAFASSLWQLHRLFFLFYNLPSTFLLKIGMQVFPLLQRNNSTRLSYHKQVILTTSTKVDKVFLAFQLKSLEMSYLYHWSTLFVCPESLIIGVRSGLLMYKSFFKPDHILTILLWFGYLGPSF